MGLSDLLGETAAWLLNSYLDRDCCLNCIHKRSEKVWDKSQSKFEYIEFCEKNKRAPFSSSGLCKHYEKRRF